MTKTKKPKGEPLDETSYEEGSRRAWMSILRMALDELGVDDPERANVRWVLERQEAIARLRSLCAEFGDNDWPDDLHLGDVIDGHLGDYLR